MKTLALEELNKIKARLENLAQSAPKKEGLELNDLLNKITELIAEYEHGG